MAPDVDTWNAPISTRRLLLAPLVAADAEELEVVLGDPALYRFTGGAPPSPEELRARCERWGARLSPDGNELWLNWVVRARHGGRALGTVQATVDDSRGIARADLAWTTGVPHQGRGYASEAARALVDHLAARGVGRFVARVHPHHRASERVATAAGLRPTDLWVEGERVWELTTPGQGGRARSGLFRRSRARRPSPAPGRLKRLCACSPGAAPSPS